MSSHPGRRRSSRSPHLFAWLLIVTLAVTAGLAYQAIDAARAQRATARAVLQDYASFAAEQYAGRVGRELSFYMLYPTLTWMKAEDMGGETPFADLKTHEAEAEPRNLRQSLAFHDALFRIDLGADSVTVTPDSPVTAEQLRMAIRAHGHQFDPEWLHALLMSDRIAYTLAENSSGPIAYGAVFDSARFDAYFRESFERGPLLPTTLIGSAPVDSVLWASVLTPDGALVLDLVPHQPASSAPPVASHSLGPQLGDLQVHVAIQPHMADRLVIGGMPASRVPLTIGLVVLTIGLIGITGIQVQRERKLARLQTDFVANVSHELRTPLAQIRMFAETLLLGRLHTGEDQTRAISVIDKEARRLTTLVDNVLHFSRLERRSMTVTPEPIDLMGIVTDVADTFRPVAAARDVTLDLDLHRADVFADRGAVRQIILNLLDNAVRYGPDGQTVTVTVRPQSNTVVLMVDDEGPGIPVTDRLRIWERFQRLDDRGTPVAGTGIGLSVVQELIRLHGGTAHVEDGTRGARFVISLPGVDRPPTAVAHTDVGKARR